MEVFLTLTRWPVFFLTALMLSAIISVSGCGGGGGGTPEATNTQPAVSSEGGDPEATNTQPAVPSGGGTPEAANTQPAVYIARAPSGDYLILGDNLDGVAGLKLTLTYDSSTMASPTVIKSDLISSGLMEPNTKVPGTIIIGVISSTPFSGSGQIAAVSFASHTGAGALAIASIELYDVKGQMIHQQVK